METGLQAELAADRRTVHLRVSEARWLGKRASLCLQQQVRTRRSGNFEETRRWPLGALELASTQTVTTDVLAHAFDYEGDLITMRWTLRVEIDDGVLFDSKIELPLSPAYTARRVAEQGASAQRLFDPVDRYALQARFQALLPEDRRKLILQSVVTAALIAINLALGWHDAAVPEAETLLYDHDWSAASGSSSDLPVMKAVLGSVVLAILAWAWMVVQFGRDVQFKLRIRKLPGKTVRLSPGQLVRGTSRVPLEGAEFRVVVADVERGLERSGNGGQRTVKQAGRAICLFRQTLPRVPANAPIESYLHGAIDFAPLYDALYPPCHAGGMGLLLEWRIQLLHPQLIDRSADGVVEHIDRDDFLR